jgi:para-nitrobenzyl esterase
VYYYQFNDVNAPQENITPGFEWLAYHSSEIQYLFDFTWTDGSVKYAEVKDASQEELSDQMTGYWASFVRNGHPNIPHVERWPRFKPDTEQILSLQPDGNTVITDFAVDHHCAFWDSLAQ